MSSQIQGMLADVLNNLNSILIKITKANEEVAVKLMAENHKLADRLTEKLHHEITEVTQAVI